MQAIQHFPHVYHIRDNMGVYMTLITGKNRALLVDTGYGLEDVHAYVRTLTRLPLTVLLTHAHHDHALGSMWFDETHMFHADHAIFPVYTGISQRKQVAKQAENKGLAVPCGFITRPIPPPQSARPETLDLGGVTAQIIPCPGHTPGSCVVYIPEYRLLLSGDDWNPCTWLFFPEALGAAEYIRNVNALLALPFEHVLCSHREALYPRSMMEAFLSGLTDEALLNAVPVQLRPPIDTREAHPAPGQQFVFDYQKTALYQEEKHL